MSKKRSKCCVVSLAEWNALYPSCSVLLESSQLCTFPVVTEASYTLACIDCGQNIGPDCAELDCFVALQTDKQAELLWCALPSDRGRPAKLSRLLRLVSACLDQLRIWLCCIWRWPSSRATLLSQAKSWKLDEYLGCAAVSKVQGATANGTSRYILTGPVSVLTRQIQLWCQSISFFLFHQGYCRKRRPPLTACVL